MPEDDNTSLSGSAWQLATDLVSSIKVWSEERSHNPTGNSQTNPIHRPKAAPTLSSDTQGNQQSGNLYRVGSDSGDKDDPQPTEPYKDYPDSQDDLIDVESDNGHQLDDQSQGSHDAPGASHDSSTSVPPDYLGKGKQPAFLGGARYTNNASSNSGTSQFHQMEEEVSGTEPSAGERLLHLVKCCVLGSPDELRGRGRDRRR